MKSLLLFQLVMLINFLIFSKPVFSNELTNQKIDQKMMSDLIKISSWKLKLSSQRKSVVGDPLKFPNVKSAEILLTRMTMLPHVVAEWKTQETAEIFYVLKGTFSSIYLLKNGKYKYVNFYPGDVYMNNAGDVDMDWNPTNKTTIVHTIRLGGDNKPWMKWLKNLPSPKWDFHCDHDGQVYYSNGQFSCSK